MRHPKLRGAFASRGVIAATLASALIAITASVATACDTAPYSHNGSRMEVHACDGRLVISYDIPRSGLVKAGVRPGTILF